MFSLIDQDSDEFFELGKWHTKGCPCGSGEPCTCDEQEGEEESE